MFGLQRMKMVLSGFRWRKPCKKLYFIGFSKCKLNGGEY